MNFGEKLSMSVIAIKNGHKKRFTDEAWRMLGKNKNGWIQIQDLSGEPVLNEVAKTPVVKSNEATVTNEISATQETAVTTEEETTSTVNDNSNTESLIDFAKTQLENGLIKRNQLKDYLDSKEVSFKQSISNNDLIALVASQMNGDVEVFKAEFKID